MEPTKEELDALERHVSAQLRDIRQSRQLTETVGVHGPTVLSLIAAARELEARWTSTRGNDEIPRSHCADCEHPACPGFGNEPTVGIRGAVVYGDLYEALDKMASAWESSAGCLRGEVARGIAIRQSPRDKELRAELLEHCAEQVRRLIPLQQEPTNGR